MNISQWTIEDWANAATIAAAVGTLIAAAIAVWAVIQARLLQQEKSQPYVVALMENNSNMTEMLELSFKNVGETVARDIEISFDPKPQRSAWNGSEELQDIKIPDEIPILVPGQEWRTTWDSSHKRFKTELPHRHTVTVKYKGLKDKELSETYVLDWEHLYTRGYIDERTIHHLAKDIRDIKGLIGKAVGIRGLRGSLDVHVEELAAQDS